MVTVTIIEYIFHAQLKLEVFSVNYAVIYLVSLQLISVGLELTEATLGFPTLGFPTLGFPALVFPMLCILLLHVCVWMW